MKSLDNNLTARRLLKSVLSLSDERREALTERLEQKAYSPDEVAKILGKPIQTIRRWLREGTLKGSKVGRSWLISKAELDRLLTPDKAEP